MKHDTHRREVLRATHHTALASLRDSHTHATGALETIIETLQVTCDKLKTRLLVGMKEKLVGTVMTVKDSVFRQWKGEHTRRVLQDRKRLNIDVVR
jgi:hypothetical protein